jgi:uncharacterized membrane protein
MLMLEGRFWGIPTDTGRDRRARPLRHRYSIGTLLWITALEQVQVSQAYPFVGLGFALTTLLSWWVLGDTLSTQCLVDIALVGGGIMLVARS